MEARKGEGKRQKAKQEGKRQKAKVKRQKEGALREPFFEKHWRRHL